MLISFLYYGENCVLYLCHTEQNKINLKIYVGQTINPKLRWSQHKSCARKSRPPQYISRSIAKYGAENFIFQIIDQIDDGYLIDNLEMDWINWFKSRNHKYGYNVSFGGDYSWNRGLPKEQ